MHCTKVSGEFEFRGLSPLCAHPQNVAFGYDIGKISAGRLVWYAFYDLRRGNGTGPILTAPEPTEG